MKKWLWYAVAGCLVSLLFLIFVVWKPFQPRVNGLKLDAWWNEQYRGNTNTLIVPGFFIVNTTNFSEADAAFHQAGKKGLQYLKQKTEGGFSSSRMYERIWNVAPKWARKKMEDPKMPNRARTLGLALMKSWGSEATDLLPLYARILRTGKPAEQLLVLTNLQLMGTSARGLLPEFEKLSRSPDKDVSTAASRFVSLFRPEP